jgi:tripartite ATP-independent transporter DctM subunit
MISLMSITLFIVLMFIGVPVSASLVLATIICMVAGGYNLILLPQQMGASVGSLELLAIPFFILAANLMTALGMTRRIFDVAEAAVGWVRGGLAHANVVAGVILSGISGAADADPAALGAISLKEMPRLGYAPPFAGAVVMAVATLGPIIPPSIMMVVYAITADVSIARLFVAGIMPGFFIAAVISATIALQIRLGWTAAPAPSRFSARKLLWALWSATLALLAPVVILRGMASGWVTPTEAGVLACVYALLVGMLERTVTLRGVIGALVETAEASALILFIIAASSALSYVFVSEGTAAELSQLMTRLSIGTTSFLIVSNLLLFMLGCFIETLPAMLIAVPLLVPTAKALGVDLVHFGVVVIFNLIIGFMHPPIGIGLFIMMSISDLKFGELAWAAAPFVLALLVALAVLTFVPEITLWLPNLLLPEPGRAVH